MLNIVAWMWHDPHLQGSRGVRLPGPVAQLRADLVPSGRRLAKLIKKGKLPPPIKETPAVAPGAPRFFKPEHVVRLAQLFKKHLKVEHRFVCFTDEPLLNDDDVTWVETPVAALAAGKHRSPEGNRFPSCYRRLWIFSEDAAEFFSGGQVLTVDIDLVPVADCTPIVDRTEDFVGWRPFRDWGAKKRFGGGIHLHRTGTRTRVWTDFNGASSIAAARGAGFRGSDQAWLSYCLAEKEATYSRSSGIYSIRDFGNDHALPRDARLVQMNGPAHMKPWSYRGPATWVAQHWSGR